MRRIETPLKTINRAKHLKRHGYATKEICDMLLAEGHKPARSKVFHTASVSTWTKNVRFCKGAVEVQVRRKEGPTPSLDDLQKILGVSSLILSEGEEMAINQDERLLVTNVLQNYVGNMLERIAPGSTATN